jgi:predicted transcriptional regulator
VGVLSDRDLLKHAPDASCGEAMTAAPVTCLSNATVSGVAQLMVEHKIDSIPIVNSSGSITGLVTSTDLLSLLIDHDQANILPFDFRLRVAASDNDPVFDSAAVPGPPLQPVSATGA